MSVADRPLDVLESGPEPQPRRRAALAAALALLLLVIGAGWYLDHRSRQSEFEAISRCARHATEEYSTGTARLAAMAEYVRPSLVFAPPATSIGLYAMVAHEARQVGPQPQQVRDRCAEISVYSWHSDQRAALAAELALQDAQLDLLARIAVAGNAYYEDQEPAALLRSAAASALARARPASPW